MKDLITKKPNGFYWAANGSYTYDVLSRDNKHLEHIQPYLKKTIFQFGYRYASSYAATSDRIYVSI